ncbi:MAG: tetratricopeptide repeat protein [Blautia sp.]|nr:tetratricopeptide repeat protein [Blautia sp.]MBR6350436.1 tetratricopeptide repeat protein [Lachnospiraceae bacterium]
MKKSKLRVLSALLAAGLVLSSVTASAVELVMDEEEVQGPMPAEAEEAVEEAAETEETVEEDAAEAEETEEAAETEESAEAEETEAVEGEETAEEDLTEAELEALDVQQKLDTNYTLALNAINNEEYDKAKGYLDVCFAYCNAQDYPELYADLLLKRACIEVINGDTTLALAQLDAAIKVQPDLADAYLVRTQIYSALGEFDTAVDSLTSYIDLTEDPTLYETVAQLYEANGDLDKAQEAFDTYVSETGSNDMQTTYQSAVYKMQGGKYEEAIEIFNTCTEDEVFGAGSWYNIGICRMNLGDYPGAVEAFTSCLDNGGEFEGVYYNRGISSFLQEDWENAVEDFKLSVENEPYEVEARYNWGVCLMQMADYEGAIEQFTILIGDEELPAAEEEAAEGEEAVEEEAVEGEEAVEEEAAEGEEAAEEDATEGEEAVEEEAAEGEEAVEKEAAEGEEAVEEEAAEGEEAAEEEAEKIVYVDAYYYRAACYAAIGELEKALADYTVCIDYGYNLNQAYYQRAQVYAALGDEAHQTEDLENSLLYANN